MASARLVYGLEVAQTYLASNTFKFGRLHRFLSCINIHYVIFLHMSELSQAPC